MKNTVLGISDDEYFRGLHQGVFISLEAENEALIYAVVSQTCDVVQPKRETILLAPMTESLTETEKKGAQDFSNPRYIFLDDKYIDLAKISYRQKSEVQGSQKVGGISADDYQLAREFGLAVGRWFGRFAFPDDVHPWLDPLQKLIRSKYVKAANPLGKVLQDVAEIRIEADQWTEPGRLITVHVIVKSTALPLNYSEMNEDNPVEVSDAMLPAGRSPAEIAVEMNKGSSPYPLPLWDELVESFASVCKPSNSAHKTNPSLAESIIEVSAQLWSDAEFPLIRLRKSEQLDIDFLSEPQPL